MRTAGIGCRGGVSAALVIAFVAFVWGCGHDGDDGPECDQDQDCPALEVCNQGSGGGRCLLPGLQGGPCAEHEDCAADLRCYAEFQYHAEEACQAPGIYGYPCQQDHNCAQGFKCSLGASTHCITEKDPGEFCTSDQQCSDGMVCIAGTCTAEADVWTGE